MVKTTLSCRLKGQRIHIEWVTNEPDTMRTALRAFEWLAGLPEDRSRPGWPWTSVIPAWASITAWMSFVESTRRPLVDAGSLLITLDHSADDRRTSLSHSGELLATEAIRLDKPRISALPAS